MPRDCASTCIASAYAAARLIHRTGDLFVLLENRASVTHASSTRSGGSGRGEWMRLKLRVGSYIFQKRGAGGGDTGERKNREEREREGKEGISGELSWKARALDADRR